MDGLENLTSAEKATFQKFKSNVKDVIKPHHEDFYLVKWLHARSWDLAKAEKMFRDDQEWRAKNDVDNILTNYEPLEVLTKYYSGGYHGHAKDGSPLWIECLPTNDQKGFFSCVTKKEIVQYKCYLAEKAFRVMCPELSKKLGKRVDKAIQIIDLEGLGLKHLWLPAVDTYTEVLRLGEAHYPDTLKTVYVINAPAMFPIAYSLVKAFLSEETRSKIKVLGSNYKQHLLKEIDADQLPVNWGGTATDPDGDPYCKSEICMGGPIPEKYYRKKMLEENTDLSKFTAVTVQKGSTTQLDFPVAVKNSLLRWNFYTDNNDIAFGIFRRTSADPKQKTSDMEVIVPSERVNSHVIPEAGNILCENPGTYVVLFDNKYSWLSGKQLYYLIEVVAPDTAREIQRVDSTNF